MRDQLTTRFNEQLKTATANFTETNDRVLDTVVETNRKVVDFAVKTVKQVPASPVELPFADRIPTPAQAGERYLDMVERLVEMNRDFSERVISMLPVEATPKAAAKKSTKSTKAATKTAAKKTTAKASAAAK